MESMPMGGVAKDMATEVGAEFMTQRYIRFVGLTLADQIKMIA